MLFLRIADRKKIFLSAFSCNKKKFTPDIKYGRISGKRKRMNMQDTEIRQFFFRLFV